MNRDWQVVSDESEKEDPHKARSADLRRVGGLGVVVLVVAASTASILDQSSFAPVSVLATSRGCNPHGTASPTGSMILGREGHTATRLRSGKVLVAGGLIDPIASHSPDPRIALTASAELYDPTTGTWSATGSMKVARTFHAAALLRSGKVLVAGGRRDNPRWEPVTSAELYDPDTGNWTETGDMRDARDSFAAIVLPSGKVFVTPGLAPDNTLNAYELYDPAKGSWSKLGGPAVRFGSATLLASGQVLVIGWGSLDTAQVYDPPSNTWQPAGTMMTARDSYTSTLLPSGKVLVAGGAVLGASSSTSSSETYDPALGTWTQTNSMTSPHTDANATLLPSGEVLVAGGWDVERRLALDSVDLYDPASGGWTALGVMAAPRGDFTATLLRSGALLFAGGYGPPDDGSGFSASAEIYALTCTSH